MELDDNMTFGEYKRKIQDEWESYYNALQKHGRVPRIFSSNNYPIMNEVERRTLSDDYKYSDVLDWIKDTEMYIDELANMSNVFYTSISDYYRAINYYTDILTLDYRVAPKVEVGTTYTEEELLKGLEFVDKFMTEAMNKPKIRTVIKTALKDGAYYGYLREDNGSYYLQRLPNDRCKDGLVINGEYAINFDFGYFDDFRGDELEQKLDSFPPEFKTKYQNYVNDADLRWQPLEVEKSLCISMEQEDANFPALTSMFGDLLELSEYYDYMKQSIKAEVDKIIVQIAPMNEETGEMLVSPSNLMFFHKAIDDVLDERYKVVSTPFEIEELNFKTGKGNDSGFAGVDNMEDKVARGSGISPAISGGKDGATALMLNHDANVAYVFTLVEKIQVWINKRIKEHTSNGLAFRVLFMPTTLYNRNDYIDNSLKMLTYGGSLSDVICAMGHNTVDYMGMLDMENMLGLKDKLQIAGTAHTGGVTTDEGGRPKKDKLTDSGEQTRDSETNDR